MIQLSKELYFKARFNASKVASRLCIKPRRNHSWELEDFCVDENKVVLFCNWCGERQKVEFKK